MYPTEYLSVSIVARTDMSGVCTKRVFEVETQKVFCHKWRSVGPSARFPTTPFNRSLVMLKIGV
jgi:hypothetical protein